MNKIYVDVNFEEGTLSKPKGIDLITGDYASTEIEFTFNTDEGTKIFEMKAPSGKVVMASEITNNTILLAAKDENENNVSLFDESGLYIFEISLYNGDTKLTSVYGKLPVSKEQVIIGDEVVEPYLPVFDELMQDINTAITETNNLNIQGSKSGKITTITITKKDGTTQEITLEDGKSIEYNWSGTQLGIRQEGQSEYVYVDLKGDKGDAGAIKMIIVAELPQTGADDTIYLVPITPDTSGNNYAEYVYINGAWELLGKIGVQVDLTNYVQFTDYATSSKGGTIIASPSWGIKVSSGYLIGNTFNYSQYTDTNESIIVDKGTLENVITGKGLVSNTDYATSSTGGVIKTSGTYATNMTNGYLYAGTVIYTDYTNRGDGMLIGKGTLERVITGKGLVSNIDYATSGTGGVVKINDYYGTNISGGGNIIGTIETYSRYNSYLDNSALISKGTLNNVLDAKIGDIQTLLDNLDTGNGV